MFRSFLLVVFITAASALGQTTNPYESQIRAFEQADRQNPPPTNSILFLGSSTIVRWESMEEAFPAYSVLNRGFGGSQASDVLHFYDRLVPRYAAPLIVFYEGDNDLASGKTVDQVFADWTNFVGRVRRDLPESHVLFVSVKPSPSRASLLPVQRALNDRVRAFNAADPRLHFADVFSALLTPDGKFRPELYVSDQLHLSPAGYEAWEAAIVPVVERWAERYPVEVRRSETNSVLIDFGAADLTSGNGARVEHWNNVTTTVGASSSGVLSNLATTDGASSPLSLRMVARFNGANENGTTGAESWPGSATRDSLFGNTETFSGLGNIFPHFRLEGLGTTARYRLVFYASRMGVSDNRETRYTVTGAATNEAFLNAANNISAAATVTMAQPNEEGAISIALSPGPNNNNANHFTYLGALRVETLDEPSRVWLIDFGAAGSPTAPQGKAGVAWNDVTPSVGGADDGVLPSLQATNGSPTSAGLAMLSRFNGANANGATNSMLHPDSATRDSLFGNTESFGGLANVTPAFKLTGLNERGSYALTFYASRTGVNDNRQTRFTAAGATTNWVDLNPSNNTNAVALLEGIRPSASNEISIALSPGPENNSANHFTYLGVLRIDWVIPPRRAVMLAASKAQDRISITVAGGLGGSRRLEASEDLISWEPADSLGGEGVIEVQATGSGRFFRVVED